MKESKLEKVSDVLTVAGLSVFITGMIVAIISAIIYGLGHELLIAGIICVIGILVTISSAIVLQVDISKASKKISEKYKEVDKERHKRFIEDEKLYKDLQEKCAKLTLEQIECLVYETLNADTENLLKQKENKMSKIKELFGVEIGEEFDIEEGGGRIFKNCYFDSLGILVVPKHDSEYRLGLLGALLTDDAKIIKREKPILTEEEHDYLQAVCKPYDIDYISKEGKVQFSIDIYLKNEDLIVMPYFPKTSEMYKGMELDKPYTPEQLGIKKGE